MRVAVCIFGICRGNARENLERFRNRFGQSADFFFGTWSERRQDIELTFPGMKFMHTPEPEIHYHPIADVSPILVNKDPYNRERIVDSEWNSSTKIYERSTRRGKGQGRDPFPKVRHEIKQHLGHNWMLKHIPAKYDMIIRTRFDSKISLEVDFQDLLRRSYEEKIAIGFSYLPHLQNKNTKGDLDTIERHVPHDRKEFLTDFMIFHPRELWDSEWVEFLFENKFLHRSEIGWYQILSQPYGSNHICFNGGVVLDKYDHVLEEPVVEPKKTRKFRSVREERNRAKNISRKIRKSKTLRIGATGPEVELLQSLLDETPTGRFDANLYKRVIEYQKENGLKEDGIVGPKMYWSLYDREYDK